MSTEGKGLAHSVQARLVRHAKQIQADPNLVLTRYATERFLYRLSRSSHADRFVLKGALLLLVWLGEALRPTRDADLLGIGDLSDETLKQTIREICEAEVEPDAIEFLVESIDVQPIREENEYGGRRVTLQARLGPARIRVQIDIGIGDAMTPAPQWLDYSSMLDLPAPRLRAYRRETVVAEKVHAMVLMGMANTRMKDYFDVLALLREGALDAQQLARAIAATFERRRTAIPADWPVGLSEQFSRDAGRQTLWRAFLDKNRLQGPDLPDLMREIRAGLESALEAVRRRIDS